PSGDKDGAVTVKIVAGFGRSVDECAQGGTGCIVARRSLRYIPHTELRIPVLLQASCAGVPCQDTETCVASACVPAAIDPSTCATPQGCTLPGDTIGADAGPPPVEASTADVATSDAAPDADDAAVDATEAGIAVLATGQSSPTQIAIAGGRAYW